ncbi:hypothetical protein BG015_002692 [Linnemannia schmuckeri]|uniref:FAD-binding domain-containing protein n=1 Tax=Linnemannia schmuckeri TaxID=64567 RepID=A0A9P5RRN3_9FUNG|nr:hypothetical protein BG015_002692 [Linnemannia schmuckeri]
MQNNITTASTNESRPKVLIVGAGLAGLALGMILQKSDTPYEIVERAPEIKTLGAAISLTGTVAPMFKQVGIWNEFCTLSRELAAVQVITAPEMETAFLVPVAENAAKRYGAEGRLLPRPALYDLFIRQVPKDRLHLGKKVVTTEQGPNGVLVRCADGSEFRGDILVGADGAYSSVRQSLYAQLKEENKLPEPDGLPLPFTSICLVGQTRPLDVSQFPDLAKPQCQFKNILGKDKPYSWGTFTTKQNTVCYVCMKFLSEEGSREKGTFKNSDWSSEAAQAMCNEVRDFPIVSGGDNQLTLGDLFDWTPKELISKVMLEEKFNPSAGEGGNNAIHDAIVLANYIHALPNKPTVEEVEAAFASYKQERISWVEDAYTVSQAFRIMCDAGWKATFVRFLMKNMPKWVNGIFERRVLSNRPQVYFLPRDETPVLMAPAPQASLNLKRPERKYVVAEGITQPV